MDMARLLLLFLIPTFPASAATFTVTNTSTVGEGSLPQAITDANEHAGLDTILFNIPGTSPLSIAAGRLPAITDSLVLDGTSQPGYTGVPLIALDGGSSRTTTAVLEITAGHCTIRGLSINHLGNPGAAILISGPGGNTIQGCFVGPDLTGTNAPVLAGSGIVITNSSGNLIGGTKRSERNLISGVNRFGVMIVGELASSNVVQGSYIGLDWAGTNSLRNFLAGVMISNAPNNTIGGLASGAGNVLSGNGSQVQIVGAGATNNYVQGNWIGLDANGAALSSLSGAGDGVRIENAAGNVIGGDLPAARNIISGNNTGINIRGTNAIGNLIQGNFIGTDPGGTNAVPNSIGIYIGSGAQGTIVGGNRVAARNIVSGNKSDGVAISDSSNNVIQGNFVGTDVTGTRALGNARTNSFNSGININAVLGFARSNLVGGPGPGEGNVISGNNYAGLTILGSNTQGNRVQGNLIGLDRSGVGLLGNLNDGILLLGAAGNLIGGTNASEGNVISANGYGGIELSGTFGSFGAPSSNNVIVGNLIGLEAPTERREARSKAAARQGGQPGNDADEDDRNREPFSNLRFGIRVTFGDANYFGQPDSSLGNTIATFEAPAVEVVTGSGNAVYGGIFQPCGRSAFINLVQGANGMLVKPAIKLNVADYVSGSVRIQGTSPNLKGGNGYFQFYGKDMFSMVRERRWSYLGGVLAGTDPAGNPSFDLTLPYSPQVFVTYTDLNGNTSPESDFLWVIPTQSKDPLRIDWGLGNHGYMPRISSPVATYLQGKSQLQDAWVNYGYQTDWRIQTSWGLNGFYRAGVGLAVGSISGSIKDPAGNPATSYSVGLALGEPETSAPAGTFSLHLVPLGQTELAVSKRVQVPDPETKQTNAVILSVPIVLTLTDQAEIELKADEDVLTALPCDCSAWCGIVSAVVNGLQTVAAAGGKLGFCLEEPEVTITGPGGVEVRFPAVPIPRRKRETFSPAASGTWTITTTVCGQTKSCSVTVP